MKISIKKVAEKKDSIRRLTPLQHTRIKTKSLKWNTNRPATQSFIEELGERMVMVCLLDDGVGLAAPQIGIPQQVFIIRDYVPGTNSAADTFSMYFNPTWKAVFSDGKSKEYEGCLSVFGEIYEVERYNTIEAQWYEFVDNSTFLERTETLKGYLARVFQHEYDHLQAKSIVDRGTRVSIKPAPATIPPEQEKE